MRDAAAQDADLQLLGANEVIRLGGIERGATLRVLAKTPMKRIALVPRHLRLIEHRD